MDFYGIWISFSDDSNLFYDPRKKEFINSPMGEPMPAEFFFFLDDLNLHKREATRLAGGFCLDHEAQLHLSQIRPQDPDYRIIAAAKIRKG